MSNFYAQTETTCNHAEILNDTVTATDQHAQSLVPSNQPGANQDRPLLAKFRFAAGDLQRALTRIDIVKDEQTQWLFTNGTLVVRKCSDTITCQAPVRLAEGTGETVGFWMSDEELAQYDDILSDFCVCVHGSGYDREVVFSVTRIFASEESHVVVGCDPLWPDEVKSPPIGKVLPGSLLHEAMRVIQPFARKRERSQRDDFAPSLQVKMTNYGLGCITPGLQCVHFKADQLLDTPWFIPVEIFAKVREFVREFESFSICADNTLTYMSDGHGAFISWETPTDVDGRLPYHSLKVDQFVSHVSAKEIGCAVKYIKSCMSDAEVVAALRVSVDNSCVWFETRVDGQVVKSLSAPIVIERNVLDIEIAPQFTVDSLCKVFAGTKGESLELRLYLGKTKEDRPELWLLRSIEAYPITTAKKARKADGISQPVECRVTRVAPSVVPRRMIQLG